MPRCQDKNKINNRIDYKYALEPSNLPTADTQNCNIIKVQHDDLKIAIINLKEVLKKEMNYSIKVIYENTSKQWEEINKTVQDLVEIKSIRKKKSKTYLERKKIRKWTGNSEVSFTSRI